MRTLRLSVAGLVMMALLGGGAATAQGDEPEEASLGLSPVTGTIWTVKAHTGFTESLDEDRSRRRGILVQEGMEMDDPRLTGTAWSIWNWDTLPDSCGLVMGAGGALVTGSVEIVNDGGSWVGTLDGYNDPATMDWFVGYDLTGTGAYEGLSAVLHVTGQGGRLDVGGFVFPGVWPEHPDPVEVPE